MADTALGKLMKEVELLKQSSHKLKEAEALAKGITFLPITEAMTQIEAQLRGKYQEIGRITCEQPKDTK